MNQNYVIALVGMPGAGKSVCVEYLESHKKWPSVYFGGVTLDELKDRKMEINPDNEQFIREDLRKQYGNGIYAERIINKLEKLFDQGKKVVVADGLYSWTEYKIFKEMYGDRAIVIAITAPKQLRHQRLSTRKTRPLTAEEVTKRDYAEIENIEKGGPIANADYTLVNDKNKEKLLKDLGDLILALDLPGTH